MASEERNALAELAAGMTRYIKEQGPAWSLRKRATKAADIVAELASVEYVVDCDGDRIYLPADASMAISKCRAIAEE